MKKSMQKPQAGKKGVYDYQDMMEYLETKYNFDSRDYLNSSKTKLAYEDFWHYLLHKIQETEDVDNGGTYSLDIAHWLEERRDECEEGDTTDYVIVIFGYIAENFGDTVSVKICW